METILQKVSKMKDSEIVDYCYTLSGDSNKKQRQEVVYAITGQKLPLSKCGIHSIMKLLGAKK